MAVEGTVGLKNMVEAATSNKISNLLKNSCIYFIIFMVSLRVLQYCCSLQNRLLNALSMISSL